MSLISLSILGEVQPLLPVLPTADGLKETIKSAVSEAIAESLSGALQHLATELSRVAYSFVLIGGAVCVVLYVAGWEKGLRYTGIMFVSYAILRAILGGV